MKFLKAAIYVSITLTLLGCGEKLTAESHIKNAKDYLNANNLNASVIELKNAIRADNKNAEARFLLGQTYLNLGDGLAATKEFERAKKLKFSDTKLLPLLARAYILTDNNADVLALSADSKILAAEQQSQYLAYQTLAALRSGDSELAIQAVELAKTIDNKGLYSMLASAYLALSETNYEEVSALTSHMLSINPEQVDTLLLQGQLAMATEDYKLAVKSFTKFNELQPRFAIVKLFLANALLKAGEYQEAEKQADSMLAKVPNQPFANYVKAMVRFQAKDFTKTSEHAELALSANFNQFNLKLVAGASAFYLENWQQSYYHLNSIVKFLPIEHQARRMLTVSQLELGLINEVSDSITSFNDETEDNAQFLSSLSYKLFNMGATSEAKKVLTQSELTSPETAINNARQGILKLMMNDPSGIENLQEAVELDPKLIEAELALAFAALQMGDIEKAKEIAQKWQTKYPDKASAYNLLASIAFEEANFQKAEEALVTSLQLEPDNIFALTEQLRIARQQKNESLSKQRVDYLLESYPNNIQALRTYFGVYKNEMALGKLRKAYDANSTDIGKAVLLAEAMLSLDQVNEAEKILVTKTDAVKIPKRYWQLLLLTYQKKNDNDKVKLTLEQWLKANPYHLEPVVRLADLYASNRNYERALVFVKRGLDNHKENLVLQLIKMQLLLNSKQITPSKELYKTLSVKTINNALKQGMLGRILLLEHKYVQAIPKLTALYNAYPTSQNAIYLASAYVSNKDNNGAGEVLENYLKIDSSNNQIKTMLASIYLESDIKKSISIYNDVVVEQPKNFIAHNNLAWLYFERNKYEKALVHAETAFALAPQVANIVDTYGKVLLASGNKKAALSHARDASTIAKGKDIDIQLNYIEALMANNRMLDAKKLLAMIKTNTELQEEKKVMLEKEF
jgi:putative PEP-CTERM system TPR-repeat lipoprotein